MITKTRYSYDQTTGDVKQVDFQPGVSAERFSQRYAFDASSRLKTVHSSRNGVLWDQDVIYDYNLDGTLGRETIGEDSVQGRDYTYTLRRCYVRTH